MIWFDVRTGGAICAQMVINLPRTVEAPASVYGEGTLWDVSRCARQLTLEMGTSTLSLKRKADHYARR